MQPEEISTLIGKSTDISIYEIEKGAIRRFAEAVGDDNPLYRDEEFARKSNYRSIIAPPGFFGWPIIKAYGRALLVDFPSELIIALEKDGYPLASALDGSIEFEFIIPVRVGDVLASVSTLKDLRERSGRSGKLAFFVMETVFINQAGARVAIARAQYILRNMAVPGTASGEKANA